MCAKMRPLTKLIPADWLTPEIAGTDFFSLIGQTPSPLPFLLTYLITYLNVYIYIYILRVDKPRFSVRQHRLTYAWVGKTVNISCHARGHPVPTVDWLHNNMILANNRTFRLYQVAPFHHTLQVCGCESFINCRYKVVWLGGVVVRALDLRLEIAGSIPAAALSSSTLGKLFTHIIQRLWCYDLMALYKSV